jgi:hypothetical protein
MALGMAGLLPTTPKFSTLCHIVSFMLPTALLLVFPAQRRLMIFRAFGIRRARFASVFVSFLVIDYVNRAPRDFGDAIFGGCGRH